MYLVTSQESFPPLEVEYQLLVFPIPATVEEVLVIPVVVFPKGSTNAKQNSISQSAAIPWKADGVEEKFEFIFLKSAFKTAIWEFIWALEMFSVEFLYRTWTTTGNVTTAALEAGL